MKLWCVWVNLASSSKKLSPHGIGDWKPIGVVFLKEKALLWPELGELKFLSVAGVEVFDNNTDLWGRTGLEVLQDFMLACWDTAFTALGVWHCNLCGELLVDSFTLFVAALLEREPAGADSLLLTALCCSFTVQESFNCFLQSSKGRNKNALNIIQITFNASVYLFPLKRKVLLQVHVHMLISNTIMLYLEWHFVKKYLYM